MVDLLNFNVENHDRQVTSVTENQVQHQNECRVFPETLVQNWGEEKQEVAHVAENAKNHQKNTRTPVRSISDRID